MSDRGDRVQLDSWKAIAAYLSRDVRTVQRWEKEGNLPVRRLKHATRSTVFAWADELDEWVASRSDEPAAPAPSAVPIYRLISLGAGVALAALLLSAIGSEAPPSRDPTIVARPLTAEAGVNWGPRFSPDGSRVAYTRQRSESEPPHVVVKDLKGGQEIEINPTPWGEYSPAWSPSGVDLAFLRNAANETSDLVVVSMKDFQEKKPARLRAPPFSSGGHLGPSLLDWSPDGRFLAAPRQEALTDPYRMTLIDVETGQCKYLTDPPAGSSGDTTARFDPSAKRILITRRFSIARHELLLRELGEERSSSVKVKRLRLEGPAEIPGAAWSPDGASIVFSNRTNNLESRLWRVSADSFDVPKPAPHSGLGVFSLDIGKSPDGHWPMAFVEKNNDVDIVRIPLVGDVAQAAPPEQWTTIADSLAKETRPTISPDGRLLAFTSLRGGSAQIWLAAVESGEVRQLTNLPPGQLGHKAWSPDGSRIAYIRFGPKGRDIHTVRVSDGRVEVLLDHDDREMSQFWSRDGKFLYYRRGSETAPRMLRVPARGGEPEDLLDRPAITVQDDPRGGFIYYWKDTLYALPSPHAKPVALVDEPLWDPASFAVAESGIYYLPNDNRLAYYSFARGESTTLVRFEKPVRPGLAVSPDETSVYVTLLTRRMQIMISDDVRGVF